MLKRLLLLSLAAAMLLSFTGCAGIPGLPELPFFHSHSWVEATCLTPRICSKCGQTEGDPLDHDWQDATCQDPRHCLRCGLESGVPQDHLWQNGQCAYCEQPEPTETQDPRELYVGDIVVFGTFEQDNRTGNGPEPIEWVILDIEDGQILLVSKEGLDCRSYHTRNISIYWEECAVRDWLSRDFIREAFTAEQQRAILPTSVETNGIFTTDRIFLLSLSEVNQYFFTDYQRLCVPTAYAIAHNAYVNQTTGAGWWLLRDRADYGNNVLSINSDGAIDHDGGRVTSNRGMVRPAMWVSAEALG